VNELYVPFKYIALVIFNIITYKVQWQAKKVSHHLNVSVIKALITHLNFDRKVMASFYCRPLCVNESTLSTALL
jgi:hypothetical protein